MVSDCGVIFKVYMYLVLIVTTLALFCCDCLSCVFWVRNVVMSGGGGGGIVFFPKILKNFFF